MKKENKMANINKRYTFLELPIEKNEFYSDPEVIKYIDSLGDYKKLTQYELEDLLLRKSDDKTIIDKLIKAYMYLPIKYAAIISSKTNLSNMDLISEGNMGLIEAVNNYTLKDGDFYKYLIKNIKKSILMACITKAKISSVSKSDYDTMIRFNKIEEELTREYGRKPIKEEIYCEWKDPDYSHYLGSLYFDDKFNICNKSRYEVESLDEYNSDTILGEDLSVDLDRIVELSAIRSIIMKAFDTVGLTEEEKNVMMSLYGFSKLKTSRELSIELGIKLSKIYQIEKSAFKKIRKCIFYDLDGFRDEPIINKKIEK